MAKSSVPQFTQTQILVGLLIVAAFFIGYLLPKNGSLFGGASGTGSLYPSPSAQAGTPATPAPGQRVNVGTGHFPVLGNKDAKVTVVEFADFRCPFCEQFFTNVEPSIKKDYIDTGKVKFYFRHYAFLGPASTVAANAAECANEQGKFWAFHDYMYKNQPPESDTSMYTVDKLTQIAGNLGMDTNKFSSCLSANKYQKNVDTDFQDGQKAGVGGTPSVFINGKIIIGACPTSVFQGAINAELQGKTWSATNCSLQVQ